MYGCLEVSKSPSVPHPETIFSQAIEPVDYRLQHFAIDQAGQAYGVNANKLYAIDSKNNKIHQHYQFDASIVGFHITHDNTFVVSTDNNHWDENVPCLIYQSKNLGHSFSKIKSIDGGCALWLSISSDENNLYLGEYGPKKPGVSKRVWKRDAHIDEWEIIFQAPLESDAHIHRVAVNPYNQDLWVTVGDTKKNRGVYLSKDKGKSWSHSIDSQATAVAFASEQIYWGEDKSGFGGVSVTDFAGEGLRVVFDAGKRGNFAGSIYQMLALPDGSILAPIMKYADHDNVASIWRGKGEDWRLLMILESLPGQGTDVSSIAGPDKNGFVHITGYKLDVTRLQLIN